MANQEPLSTSNEVSKIHLPNKELVGLKKSEPKKEVLKKLQNYLNLPVGGY